MAAGALHLWFSATHSCITLKIHDQTKYRQTGQIYGESFLNHESEMSIIWKSLKAQHGIKIVVVSFSKRCAHGFCDEGTQSKSSKI